MKHLEGEFKIVCMKCRPETTKGKVLVANGMITKTIDNDIILECSACGHMERLNL